eukprot:1053529-Karenia_brevis.AAC.1
MHALEARERDAGRIRSRPLLICDQWQRPTERQAVTGVEVRPSVEVAPTPVPVSYTHLRAHETLSDL